jgi:hypothetical protein
MRLDGYDPISGDEWPAVRDKLEADLAALLRPELRSAGIDRFYVLSSSEAGIVDPPWSGIFSTAVADVFREKLVDRWQGPGAAFLLNDSLREFGRGSVVAIAVHEAAHVAACLTRGIDVAVARKDPERLASLREFGPDSLPIPQATVLQQHSPEWCRLTVHMTQRMERLGWPIAHSTVIGYPELGQFHEYRDAMAGELWRLNTASLSEIVATGPHAGVNEVWVRNVVAATNVPAPSAKPKRRSRAKSPAKVLT